MKEYLAFIVGVMIPTYEIVTFVIKTFGKGVRRVVVHNPVDDIVYTHYKQRRMKDGHAAKYPADCKDGECVKLK